MSAEELSDQEATAQILKTTAEMLQGGSQPEQIVSRWVALGLEREDVAFFVRQVVGVQAGARRGDLGYWPWLKTIIRQPFGSGVLVGALVVLTVPLTFFAVIFGLRLFPSGTYPRLVLGMPGLLAGAAFFWMSSALLFLARQRLRN